MKKKASILLLLMILTVLTAKVNLSGIVTDENNTPIEGVSVLLKGQDISDVTNADGEYSLIGVSTVVTKGSISQGFALENNGMTFSAFVGKRVEVALYSLQGKFVKELLNDEIDAASRRYLLSTDNLASGVYLMRVQSEAYSKVFKQSLIDGQLVDISSEGISSISKTRGREVVDTLVFSKEGYKTVELPIEEFEGEVNQAIAKEGDEIPDSFTKKVVFEELTGLWCGFCPLGALKIKEKSEELGDRFIAVAIHAGDALQIPKGKSLANRYAGSGYPSCVVDRGKSVHPSSSDGEISTSLNKVANCGLKIDATKEGEVTVTAAFLKTISQDVRLTVYLLESKIPNSGIYKQSDYNDYLWDGYTNDHSLAEVLTDHYLGDKVNADGGTSVTKTYSYDISKTVNKKADNCSIVAILNVVGSSASGDRVLNGQEVHLGEMKDFD